jgi:uncharacterized Zn finger protein
MPNFDIEIISHRLNPKIYERAERYYEEGRVRNLRLLGKALTAEVEGAEEYKVRIENIDGDLTSYCSCPFEDEDFCKHSVAVLLAWKHRGENEDNKTVSLSDEERQTHLKKLLRKKSKEELADFILDNIDDDKKELILAEETRPNSKNSTIFSRSIKAKINGIFRKGRFIDYQTSFKLSSEVSNITVAIEKASQKDPLLGLELSWYLLKKAKNIFNDIDDSSGSFSTEIDFVSEIITHCLDRLKTSQYKNQIIKEIFQEWQSDGYGYFDCLQKVLIEAQLSKTEITHLLPDVESRIKEINEKIDLSTDEINKRHNVFSLSQLIFLYTRFKIKAGDVEAGLNRFSQYLPLTLDYEALGRILIELRHFQEAEAVLLEGLEKSPGLKDEFYDELIYIYEQSKEKEKLKDISLKYFHYMPSEFIYKKLKNLNLSNWDKIKTQLVSFVDKPQHYHVLIQICVSEGQLLKAFNLAKKYDAGLDTLEQLGKILTESHPEEAIYCYKKVAEHQISGGSRYYWAATKFIEKIRKIYIRQDKKDEFEKYLSQIKEKHRLKRTLLEKLSRFS